MRTLRAVSLFPLLAAAGCRFTEDTCNGGSNMTSPRLVDGLEEPDAGASLRITWEPGTGRGATLPSSYFDDPFVGRAFPNTGVPADFILGVTHPAEHELDLAVDAGALRRDLSADAGAGFVLAFGDRNSALACHHPASPDHYFLDVTLFSEPDGGIDGSLREIYQAGAY